VGNELFGDYHVRPTGSAIRDARRLFPRYRDYQQARKHALKLAYWPRLTEEGSLVVDMEWEWITSLREEGIGELKLRDQIGGAP
jgi:hypothetical protein